MLKNKVVFDFSASYSGGGLKRLQAIVRYMDAHGGAVFLINKKVEALFSEYRSSQFIVVNETKFERLFPFSFQKLYLVIRYRLKDFHYYSYGIPVLPLLNSRSSHLHISNVLPFASKRYGLSMNRWLQLQYLGVLFRLVFLFYKKITVESKASLSFIPSTFHKKCAVSPNGIDEEYSLSNFGNGRLSSRRYAVAIGVQPYKNVYQCIDIFKKVRSQLGLETLYILGGYGNSFVGSEGVIFEGELRREKVLDFLRSSALYISCTDIENSYNAAAEGVFLSEFSILSAIPVHLEFVKALQLDYKLIEFYGIQYIEICRQEIKLPRYLSWDFIVEKELEGVVNVQR